MLRLDFKCAVAIGVLFAAGCSANSSLPFSGGSVGSAITGITPSVVSLSSCTNPKKVKVCVPQGGSAPLKIKLICHKQSGSVPCGKVKWSTKTSNSGLTASFKPNPGNPTTETVTASKTIKPGNYTQAITADCSFAPHCVAHISGQIVVLKP